jgi:outer membrane protein assembly factor BamD
MNFRSFASIFKSYRLSVRLIFLTLAMAFLSGCALIHHPGNSSGLPMTPGAQPDKILLQKAENEFQHGRYDTGRLLLQSMINTYPDSEYLSQAKLAIANSYFKQGGISGLTEAEAEFKDFITFFPTAPEAPMAEYQAGMCHFRLMGKEDRDQTEANEAAQEFQEFLLKFPDSPLMPLVKDRLREVQEVLAGGDFQIAMFYYRREANKAASQRFKEIVDKYPSFSQGDQVFWYLGQTYARLQQPRLGIAYYDRLIMEFPLSPLTKNAREQLVSLRAPVPTPSRAVMARAQADAVRDQRRSLVAKALGGFSSTPDLSKTLHGPVMLQSPNQIQVRIARLNAPKPSPPNATLSAQAVSVTRKVSRPQADPNSNHTASTSTASSRPAKTHQAASAQKSGSSSTRASLPQKKDTKDSKDSKLHFLKKVIPF